MKRNIYINKILKYILKENENILEINKYIKFLIEKRIEMKYYNLFLSTKIDYIKDDNKELLINIKEKSEYLWKLFDIRNLLICVKEKMLIRDLPLIFHFYNTSYLSIIIKKYNNYIDLLETQKKYVLNNPLINLKIPTNLVEYIYLNRKKEIQKEKVDKKFLKYLDPKFPIFENADEFIKTFSAIEERTVDYFLYFYVSEKYRNDNFKRNINKNKGFIKCEVKYLKEIIEECETILFNLKERNKNLNNYLFLIKKEYDYKYKKELENDKEKELKKQKINKLFLRSINNTTSLEKNKFYFFLNNLKNEKKFAFKNAYTYYIISRNVLEMFNKLPKYFYKQINFSLDEFNLCINNINNLNNIPLNVIIDNIIYLLNLYETAISFFLVDYKNIIKKDNEIIDDIAKEISINKKINLVKFSKILNEKKEQIKEENLNKKNNKMVIKERKLILPNINNCNNKSITIRKSNLIIKKNINPYSSLIFY